MHPDTIINNPGLVHRNCLKAGSAFLTTTTLASTALLTSCLGWSQRRPHTPPLDCTHTILCICYILCMYTYVYATYIHTYICILMYILYVYLCICYMLCKSTQTISASPALYVKWLCSSSAGSLLVLKAEHTRHFLLPTAFHHLQEINSTHFPNSYLVHAKRRNISLLTPVLSAQVLDSYHSHLNFLVCYIVF